MCKYIEEMCNEDEYAEEEFFEEADTVPNAFDEKQVAPRPSKKGDTPSAAANVTAVTATAAGTTVTAAAAASATAAEKEIQKTVRVYTAGESTFGDVPNPVSVSYTHLTLPTTPYV